MDIELWQKTDIGKNVLHKDKQVHYFEIKTELQIPSVTDTEQIRERTR